ncbi:helix-turn-helix domain-containing protein [Paenibacillus filicis]|uniref:Helix-turn-helix domain-containing protein n=1 Tax=Paenibacillus filicis TaxID=669464 RepID=A0ABU9DHS1_9BACL
MAADQGYDEYWQHVLLELVEAEPIAGFPYRSRQPHVLKHHTLLLFVKGRGELLVNGVPARIAQGTQLLLPPGTKLELSSGNEKPLEGCRIQFELFRAAPLESGSYKERRTYERELSFPVQGMLDHGLRTIQRLILLLVSDNWKGKASDRLRREQLLLKLLETVLEGASPSPPDRPEYWLESTLSQMLEHYPFDMKIDRLAEAAGMQTSYFSQRFKQKMSKSPTEFLTDLRINRAKEQLLTADKPNIREIARSVGYRDEFYFSRRFKAQAGCAPTVYTKRLQEPKVISLSYPCTDHLLALGIVPEAAQSRPHLRLETRMLPLPLHASDPWEIGRQTFLDIAPDLIICKDNVRTKAQASIGDVAPILALSWKSLDVFGHLTYIAAVVGREREAEVWKSAHEQKVELARKTVRSHTSGMTLGLCMVRGGEFRLYAARNIGHVFYRSLELVPPEPVKLEMEKHEPGTQVTWVPFAPESLPQYGCDAWLFVTHSDQDLERVQLYLKSPGWRTCPSIRKGRYQVSREWNSWMTYAPLSIDMQLEKAVALLSEL